MKSWNPRGFMYEVRRMTCKCLAAVLVLAHFALPLRVWGAERVLFEFDQADVARQWQTVNDGVMGGRSEGRFTVDEGSLKFFGKLSLENNGGFASVRSKSMKVKLQDQDSLVLRVKGDGRKYSFNLYVPRPRVAFSYRAMFPTRKDEWIKVTIPLTQFQATWFGRVDRNDPLVPQEVDRIGILLGDKRAGPFRLEVDWIKVIANPEEETGLNSQFGSSSKLLFASNEEPLNRRTSKLSRQLRGSDSHLDRCCFGR